MLTFRNSSGPAKASKSAYYTRKQIVAQERAALYTIIIRL